MDRVYIFKVKLDSREGYIYKIGKSSGKSSIDRLLQVQRAFFMQYRYITFAAIIRDRPIANAFEIETKLHQHFKEKNYYHGKKFDGSHEFFKCDEDDLLREYDSLIPLKRSKPKQH